MEKAFAIRWNVVGFAGGGAFLLSFLLGILSGNPFLTILLRALLFGVVFALLGGGGAFLLDRFVPQLSGGGEGPSAESSRDENQETNVNIVLDEAEPVKDGELEELTLEESEPAESRAAERTAAGAITPAEVPHPGAFEAAGDEDVGSLESGEVLDGDADDMAAPAAKTAFARNAGGDESEEPDPAAAAGKKAGDGIADRERSLEEGDLDVLPDMSSFESSFSPVTSGGMVNDTDSFESFGTDSLKKSDLEKDPETYVKAVRTILKRDEGKKK